MRATLPQVAHLEKWIKRASPADKGVSLSSAISYFSSTYTEESYQTLLPLLQQGRIEISTSVSQARAQRAATRIAGIAV